MAVRFPFAFHPPYSITLYGNRNGKLIKAIEPIKKADSIKKRRPRARSPPESIPQPINRYYGRNVWTLEATTVVSVECPEVAAVKWNSVEPEVFLETDRLAPTSIAGLVQLGVAVRGGIGLSCGWAPDRTRHWGRYSRRSSLKGKNNRRSGQRGIRSNDPTCGLSRNGNRG